jgi:hypothetical protein
MRVLARGTSQDLITVADPAGIHAVLDAVRDLHGCQARWVRTVHVREYLPGHRVFEREVEVFDLVGHAQASLAYAWSEQAMGNKRRFFAVLHVPPVDSATAAVRATILADGKVAPTPTSSHT